jgi:hypothetical protein
MPHAVLCLRDANGQSAALGALIEGGWPTAVDWQAANKWYYDTLLKIAPWSKHQTVTISPCCAALHRLAGPWPDHRRSHAAALVGHQLFVHGGLGADGKHLADMWCLDMQAWKWTQCSAAEVRRHGCSQPAGSYSITLDYILQNMVTAAVHLPGNAGYDMSSMNIVDAPAPCWCHAHQQSP